MIDYFQREKERIEKMNAEFQRDIERMEQRAQWQKMLEDALREHDQKIQLDIQTTLNGNPVSMNGLANDIRKQLISEMQKALK